MDLTDEDADGLNEETFECAEAGDWELDHEEFVAKRNYVDPVAPDANQLPRFYEGCNDFSLLWPSELHLPYESTGDDDFLERRADVEDYLQKLVADDTFEDPAILDVSKKVANNKLSISALDSLISARAYPNASGNILNKSNDIWSSRGLNPPKTLSSENSHITKDDQIPLSLFTLLKLANKSKNGQCNAEPSNSPNSAAAFGSIPLPRISQPSDYLTSNKTFPSTCLTIPDILQRTRNTETSKFTSPFENILPNPPTTLNNLVSQDSVQFQNYLVNGSGISPSRLPELRFFQSTPPPGLTNLIYQRPPLQSPLAQPLLRLGSSATVPNAFHMPPTPGLAVSQSLPHNAVSQLSPAVHYNLRQAQQQHLGQPPPGGNRFLLSLRLPTIGSPLRVPSVHPCPGLPGTPSSVYSRLLAESSALSTVQAGEFDPDRDGWMSEYEIVGVMMSYLRPLVINNPYVEDYYFAVHWLSRLAAARSRQQLLTSITPALPPISMSVPSPVTPEKLADAGYFHYTSVQRKFVIPLSQFTASMQQQQHSATTGFPSEAAGEGGKSAGCRDDQASQPVDQSGFTNALGRPSRSNPHRPRVIVELSLSGLAEDEHGNGAGSELTASCAAAQTVATDDLGSTSVSTSSTRASRRRLLVLAWIERMFTLVLHIAETDLSIERIVVQNEMRTRLCVHRTDLIVQAMSELLSPTTGLLPGASAGVGVGLKTDDVPDERLISIFCLLVPVRKGARLLAGLLPSLPSEFKHKCLRSFLCGFAKINSSCSQSIDELAPIIYPALRQSIYQKADVNTLLTECFPDAHNPACDLSEVCCRNSAALLDTSVGSSLIFCLLDTCARRSSPDDPSDFIRFGVFFTRLAAATSTDTPTGASSSSRGPQEQEGSLAGLPALLDSFSHLASILPLYLAMSQQPPIPANQVAAFCQRIDGHRQLSANGRLDVGTGHPTAAPLPGLASRLHASQPDSM